MDELELVLDYIKQKENELNIELNLIDQMFPDEDD